MGAQSNTSFPKQYISERIKLEFQNNSNLKTDIQNRITGNTQQNFIIALNNMQGDDKNGNGTSFSELTRLAMAYFYSEIFKDKIKDSYYSLEMVKGFLDANNLTQYTTIHEIDVTYYKLCETPYFKHCWLIIQSAWFFNSEHFGHHQHIDFVNHYIETGLKLPIENYKYDPDYLEKKYCDIAKAKEDAISINGFHLVNKWYHSILFLLCKELRLPTTNFIVSSSGNREYNPLTKSSRQLRCLAPFKIVECDIKSAFPTFLDAIVGSRLKENLYNNIMKSKQITRGQAKILFNKMCNSGKYNCERETIAFFLECGYTQKQCEHLITLTHNPLVKFNSFLEKHEESAISSFVIQNNLQRGTRLHDALVFLDDKTKPSILQVDNRCDFGFKWLNRPVIKNSFSMSNKRLPYVYINSIPKGFHLISKYENTKPSIKGISEGFRFYSKKYEYISASFNLNSYNYLRSNNIDPQVFFENQCFEMLETLHCLNKRKIKPIELEFILKHIRSKSNYVFNVRASYSRLIKYSYTPTAIIKERDYDMVDNLKFKKNIHFLNALNKARAKVNSQSNHYELASLLQERIINVDFGFLNEAIITGRKSNNPLTYAIIKMFNQLCNGMKRPSRKRVKNDTLYKRPIKSVSFNAITLNSKTKNATLKRMANKQEREKNELETFKNNRLKVQQLYLILCDIIDQQLDLEIGKDEVVQNQIKAELIAMIDKKDISDPIVTFEEFNKRYIKYIPKLPTIYALDDVFETDMNNSHFNQISIQEASSNGDKFFKEYLKFHNLNEEKGRPIPVRKRKEVYKLPELDFEN